MDKSREPCPLTEIIPPLIWCSTCSWELYHHPTSSEGNVFPGTHPWIMEKRERNSNMCGLKQFYEIQHNTSCVVKSGMYDYDLYVLLSTSSIHYTAPLLVR